MKQKEEKDREILDALDNKEFVAYYQPQYDTITGSLVSAEALARWIKPDGTFISPIDFIPHAEETGIVVAIDWYILHEACKFIHMQEQVRGHAVPIAVNFSRLHIGDKDFVQKLCDIVDSYNISHEMIEIELTESVMVDHSADIISFVKEIRSHGFRVAIDDFGSGFSSLGLIHDIAADVLKIDKALISKNCESDKERIVLESIFAFAQRLKLRTIAEGVETDTQLGFLRTCGCTCIQGYIFAKPMPAESFLSLSDDRNYNQDILSSQSAASATNLLMEAIFTKFPLVMMSNLTRNSYYMMAYEDFTQRTCPAAGCFDELIEHGTMTMHPDDQLLFSSTFSRDNLLQAYARGEKCVRCVTRQKGDDGIYRQVETCDYFVKSPSVDDVLVIILCQNI